MSENDNDNMSLENDSTPLNDILKIIGEEYGIEGQPEIEVPDEEPDSLEPCPHCGETNTMVQSISSTFQHGAYRWLHCETCGASGPWVETDKQPGDAWNHRPIEDALRAELAQLREAIRWIPVGERLPEENYSPCGYSDDVEVGFAGADTATGWYDYETGSWRDCRDKDITVTHWRPMPAGPTID